MAFERRYQPLLPRREFFFRYVRWGAAAATILFGSLTIGVIGYHFLDGIPWIDSLLNASMILGGMGPVDALKNNSAKLELDKREEAKLEAAKAEKASARKAPRIDD
jgi:hypothetical protein